MDTSEDTTSTINYEYMTSDQCDPTDINDFSSQVLPPLYYIIFFVSVVGNGVVLFILYKFEKLSTVTNIFLINLVVSNVVFTFTLPFQAVYHSDEWIFGEALCKVVNGAYYLGFYSSILFLTLMTFDRYLAVVHCVVSSKRRRGCYAVLLSAIVWSISLVASLEPLFHFTVKESQMSGLSCQDSGEGEWRVFGLYKQFVFFFIFPLAVFVYCYARITVRVISTGIVGKHRTVRLVFVIVLMFFVCWSPHNIILLINENKDKSVCDNSLDYALRITSNIARLYFCINPIFLTFLGKKFQNHVRRLLGKKVSCIKQYNSHSGSSRSLA